MSEDYIIALLMHKFNFDYDFAYSLYRDLERRNLLQDLIVKINEIDNSKDFVERYY